MIDFPQNIVNKCKIEGFFLKKIKIFTKNARISIFCCNFAA